MSSTAWGSNQVAKVAKAGRAAVKAAPVAAATAPAAAGGLGFVLLALGAVWAISRVTGPIGDIFKGAETVIRAPSEFGAGLFTGEKVERDVPISKYQFVPELPTTHFTVEGSGVTVTNPSPSIPPPRFYEFDQPSAAREAGIYIRGSIDDAIRVSDLDFYIPPVYTGDPFKGKIPIGPEFDLLAPFRGLFGGEDEPQLRDALYRGEPVQIVNLPFKGETPEMIYAY